MDLLVKTFSFSHFVFEKCFDVSIVSLTKLFFLCFPLRWLNDLFKLGMQRSLDMSDIYKTLNEHKSGPLVEHFERLWNEETKKKRPRLFNVIRKIYAKKIIGVSILFTIIDAISRCVEYKAKRNMMSQTIKFIFAFIFVVFYCSTFG